MGSEIAAVPDTLCTDISNDLAKISKRMMDLAAQLRALAAQSAEQTMSLGAAKRSYRYAVTALRPRKLIFKRSLVAALRHCSSQTVSSRVPFQQLGERRGLLLHPPATMTMAQFPEAESAGGLETRGVNAALSKFGTFLTKKAKYSKLTTKKRDKRTWTAEEEKLLIDILYGMNDFSWKVDAGHKFGYLTFIEKEMAKVLPRAELKADPHIKSKVKILKKQLSYIMKIQQNGSGFGWDDENKMVTRDRDIYMGWADSRQGAGPLYMKPMLHCDKLYEICASDLDKGGNANGPEEQQGVEEFSVLDEGDPVSHHVDKVALQPHGNENPTAPKGRKRVFADVDNLETSLCNVPNSFAKFLEAEKENGMQMAMMNTVQT
uniref:Myb/SANT-like domain-containing protein n=1 Tax=Oryza meridionalis TaxID=40149 RepID=A0A0E0E0N8_9ORYZ